jgi:hypothetical protein
VLTKQSVDWAKAPEGATHYSPSSGGMYAKWWRHGANGTDVSFVCGGNGPWLPTDCAPDERAINRGDQGFTA